MYILEFFLEAIFFLSNSSEQRDNWVGIFAVRKFEKRGCMVLQVNVQVWFIFHFYGLFNWQYMTF